MLIAEGHVKIERPEGQISSHYHFLQIFVKNHTNIILRIANSYFRSIKQLTELKKLENRTKMNYKLSKLLQNMLKIRIYL